MKKLFHILLFALLAGALASCTIDGSSDQIPKKPHADKTLITFGFESPETRADVWNQEYYIYTLAVFVETQDGRFHKFLTTEPDGSEFGFELIEKIGVNRPDLWAVTNQHIMTATFAMPADHATITNVVIVANYARRATEIEADITAKLMAATSLDDLAAIKVPAPTNGVTYLDGLVSFKILNPAELVSLNNTGTVQEIELKRLAARITPTMFLDVRVDDGTGVRIDSWNGLFQLGLVEFERILIYNPKTAGYLLPDLVTDADKNAIPQKEYFDKPWAGNTYRPDIYLYEMTGEDPEPITIYVIYSYRPNNSAAWQHAMSSITIGKEIEGQDDLDHCILKYNHQYSDFEFPVTVDVDLGSVADWNNGWNLVGRQ